MAEPTRAGEALRRAPLFAGLGDAELAEFAARAVPVALAPGEVLVEEGEQAEAMYVVTDGSLEASKLEGGRPVRLGVYGPGEVLGELALLARRARSATVRALRPSRLLRIDERDFAALVEIPSVALGMLQTVLQRLENQEARLREHAKMAALGTLAAGLLHDLNNPAAAVRASIRRLGEVLEGWRALAAELARLDPEAAGRIDALRGAASPGAPAGGPLERSDREEELHDWLAGAGVAEPWELAPALAELGWTAATLAGPAAELPPDELPLALRWLVLDAEVARLLDDAGRGAEHIADISRRSKHYSRLDEAPIGDVDINDGLETVLALVRSKADGVTVRREYAADLPPVEGYPADLNEAWLNLVDNALDALEGSGELVLRTGEAGPDAVAVEVIDDGPGVAADTRERIFEPFFTTKPVGSGTGLGLAQVYRIVVQQHGGDVEVDSSPGHTVFRVVLPRRLPPGLSDRREEDGGVSSGA